MQFPEQAASLIATYDAFEAYRGAVKKAFTVMYALLATIMLLSAVWVGLDFVDRLVAPIRALIAATDQVSAGNLDVRVDVERSHGDLARLGAVFNNMTSEIEQQQSRLLAANRQNEERRLFTEAVLSGVPAAVIGVDAEGRINVLNRSAEELLVGGAGTWRRARRRSARGRPKRSPRSRPFWPTRWKRFRAPFRRRSTSGAASRS